MTVLAGSEFLHGTLDVLILKTLSWGPRHGYAIARWLETGSGDALQIEGGSLYPALYRLERRVGHHRDQAEGEVLPPLARRARPPAAADGGVGDVLGGGLPHSPPVDRMS